MAKHIRINLNVLFCSIIHPFRLVLEPVTKNKISGFWEIIKSQFRSELSFFFFDIQTDFYTYPPTCIQFVMPEMIAGQRKIIIDTENARM